MTGRDLEAEIVAALTEGERTMLEVARKVKARNQDVIDTIRALEASGRLYQADGPDGRIVYGLPSAPTGTAGKSPTDCDRLLAVLSDGREHSHLELYQLGMIVHSRVADLRKRGHVIHTWRERHPNGTRHMYRLVGTQPLAEREAVVPAVSPSASGSVLDEQGPIPGGSPACHAGAHDEVATGKGLAASIEPLQLSIGEAA